ncbi:MAG: hypothetical protein ACLGHG_04885 [Gammaproteobacteria bacterium]
MWWFTRKAGKQLQEETGVAPDPRPASPRSRREQAFLALVPDMSAITGGQEVAIKIWLPESVAWTVKQLSDYAGRSQSAWLRELLLQYVYGRVAATAERIRSERDEDGIRFSRRPVDRTQGRWIYKVPQLGKNTVAFKLWVSVQMRGDLEKLAQHAGVGLSAFVREAIIADLLGHASLPERPEIIGQATPEAQAWERDEVVPIIEVESDDYDGLADVEREWRTE